MKVCPELDYLVDQTLDGFAGFVDKLDIHIRPEYSKAEACLHLFKEISECDPMQLLVGFTIYYGK